LIENSITSLKFFINAVDTKTTGVDLVATFNKFDLGPGRFGASLAANYNETSIEGQIATPAILAQNNYDIFNRKEQSRITTSRPQTKVILGLDYTIKKFNFILNNTYFGEVTWQHADNGLNGAPLGPGGSLLPANDEAYDQTFGGKIVTDLIINFNISERVSLFASANNLFNVYPDEIDTRGDFVTDLGGRFKYPWEVNQFGFNGTIINGGLSFSF
jgi:iron complex outermembrane receptor protein